MVSTGICVSRKQILLNIVLVNNGRSQPQPMMTYWILSTGSGYSEWLSNQACSAEQKYLAKS